MKNPCKLSEDEIDRIILKHIPLEKMMEGWKPDYETLRELVREVIQRCTA